jgi:hypothetical protein
MQWRSGEEAARRELDLAIIRKPQRLSAKQAPAKFKVQCRERSPLMGHLQRFEVARPCAER